MDDLALLHRYRQEGAEEAFAAVVARHSSLVYSVAKRIVGPDLARDVGQAAFLELARHAGRLREGTNLATWLYVVARRAAIDVHRRETRRRIRELNTLETSAMRSDPEADWGQLAPHIDEAIARLTPADQTAVVLRFFENQGLREVGIALGTSEDAAQKRVNRALDRMRAFLAQRGLPTAAAALALALTAHAVEPAPAGFAAASTRAAQLAPLAQTASLGTVLTSSAALLVAAALVAWQAQGVRALRAGLAAAQQQAAVARQALAQTRLAPAVAPPPPADPLRTAAQALTGRVDQLRAILAADPKRGIPELRLLTETDWLTVARKYPDLSSDAHRRRALSDLRYIAKAQRLGPAMQGALALYSADNPGIPLSSAAQLAPYFVPPVGDDILSRYAVVADSTTAQYAIAEPNTSWVDDAFECTIRVGRDAVWGMQNFADTPEELQTPFDLKVETRIALEDYLATHGGAAPTKATDLAPFFKSPAEAQRFLADPWSRR